MDKMCAKYSCSCRMESWLLAIFYKVANIRSTNSYISLNVSFNYNPEARFSFVEKMADELVKSPSLVFQKKDIIHRIQVIPISDQAEKKLETHKYCYIIPAKIRRKTAFMCFNCKKQYAKNI